jgi:hypothetical protein
MNLWCVQFVVYCSSICSISNQENPYALHQTIVCIPLSLYFVSFSTFLALIPNLYDRVHHYPWRDGWMNIFLSFSLFFRGKFFKHIKIFYKFENCPKEKQIPHILWLLWVHNNTLFLFQFLFSLSHIIKLWNFIIYHFTITLFTFLGGLGSKGARKFICWFFFFFFFFFSLGNFQLMSNFNHGRFFFLIFKS